MIKFYRDKILQGMKVFTNLTAEMMDTFRADVLKIESEMTPDVIPDILGFKKYRLNDLLDIFDYRNGKQVLFNDLTTGEGYYTLCKLKEDSRFELWIANNHYKEVVYSNLVFNSNNSQIVKVVSNHEYPFMFYNGSYNLILNNSAGVYADLVNFRCYSDMSLPQYVDSSLTLYSKKIKLIKNKKNEVIAHNKIISLDEKKSFKPICTIYGEVLKQEIVKNPINNKKFILLQVKTASAVFNVLTKPKYLKTILDEGNYIKAEGWLNCRFKGVNDSE